jgi:hypothetical protein
VGCQDTLHFCSVTSGRRWLKGYLLLRLLLLAEYDSEEYGEDDDGGEDGPFGQQMDFTKFMRM